MQWKSFVYHWFTGDLQQLKSIATGSPFPTDKLSFLCFYFYNVY